MKRSALVTVVLLAIVAGTLVGCTSNPKSTDGSPATGTSPAGQPPTSSGLLAAPGLYEVEGGKTQALGTLDYRDLEGGFWAVVDTADPEKAAAAAVVAVVPNAATLGVDLDSMKGSYVSVIGKKLEGVSTRQAGPEIEAERIEIVTDTTVQPK